MSRSPGVQVQRWIRGRGNVCGRFQRKIDRVKVKPQSTADTTAAEYKKKIEKL